MLAHGQPDEDRLSAGSIPHARADPSAPGTGALNPGGVVTPRTWGLVLAAGIAAGVCSWLVTEGVMKAYLLSLLPPMKPIPTVEDARQIIRAKVVIGTVVFGMMGGLLGIAFGLAGGGWRRSVGAAGMAGAVGLLAGSAVVAGVAWVVLPFVYTRLDPQSHDLGTPLLYHELLWSFAGAVGGGAFGLGAGGRSLWVRTAIGGWVGAALAIVVYELVGALAFPTHQTQFPLAGSPETRAMAWILVALGAAIGMILAAKESKSEGEGAGLT